VAITLSVLSMISEIWNDLEDPSYMDILVKVIISIGRLDSIYNDSTTNNRHNFTAVTGERSVWSAHM